MKFQLAIGDRVRSVDVQRRPDGFDVSVDGRRRLVEAVPLGAGGWSLIVRDDRSLLPRSVEAVVIPQAGNGTIDVHIDGYHIPVHVRNGVRRTRAASGADGSGPQRIVAPMPGKVLRILVKVGEEVAARQGLVVVEAMKMENELRAARAGHVRDIVVTEGQSVEAGTALITVE
jgi:biotin carboxyl carrier protein